MFAVEPGWRTTVLLRLPLLSVAVGVGSNASHAIRRSDSPPYAPDLALRARNCSGVPPGWFAVGVGSNHEESGPSVGGTDVGCSYNHPPRIHPDSGKVGEDGVKPKSKVP